MPRRTPGQDDAGQLKLAFHVPYQVIPQGDGSMVIRPGKPVEWLSVGEFARIVGLHRNTIYPYVGSADLPDQYIQYSGPRRIRISALAVAHWQSRWAAARGLGQPST